MDQETLSGKLITQYLAIVAERNEALAEALGQTAEALFPGFAASGASFAERVLGFEMARAPIAPFGGLEEDEARLAYVDHLTRMKHLDILAGMQTHGEAMRKKLEKGEPFPGTPASLAQHCGTVEEMLRALEESSVSLSLTTHPTDNSSKEFMMARTSLCRALKERDSEALAAAMEEFARAPLLPQKDGVFARHSVTDEAETSLRALENLYRALPGLYADFDAALTRKAMETGEEYDPAKLHLHFIPNDWAMGDKDGNPNVNAYTTAYSAIIRTEMATRLLAENMGLVEDAGAAEWSGRLAECASRLQEAAPAFLDLATPPDAEATRHVFSLIQESAGTWAKARGAMQALHERTEDETMHAQTLQILRQTDAFGPHMAKLEYRETSEEFTRIVSLILESQPTPVACQRIDPQTGETSLIPYREATRGERTQLLTRLLQDGEAPELLRNAASVIASGEGRHQDQKPYESDAAIAFHTCERLKLSLEFPDMVGMQILAECQGAGHMLEVLLLMQGLEKDGKKLALPIGPLYEAPEILENIYSIQTEIYDNPAYRAHMREVAEARPESMKEEKYVQHIQIAHSDNFRRSGHKGARGNIEQAHYDAQKAAREAGPVTTAFFEGGSILDPARGGGRDQRAIVTQLGMKNYKTTVQGGDFEVFYHEDVARRFIGNLLTACAEQATQAEKQQTPIEILANEALKATIPYYQEKWFKPESIGLLIGNAGLGAEAELGYANVGSRGQRKKVAFSKVESTELGAIDPANIRTINFSEVLQQAGVTPVLFGVADLERAVAETVRRHGEEANGVVSLDPDYRRLFEMGDAPEASAQRLRSLYEGSANFRHTIDILAQGLARSDPGQIALTEPMLGNTVVMQHLEQEYIAGGITVLKCLDHAIPRELLADDVPAQQKIDRIRQELIREMPELAASITLERKLGRHFNEMKRAWKETHPNEEIPLEVAPLFHALGDTKMHCYDPRVIDRAYALSLQNAQEYALRRPVASLA
jgi:phosphoenolpyruvate carboxylase